MMSIKKTIGLLMLPLSLVLGETDEIAKAEQKTSNHFEYNQEMTINKHTGYFDIGVGPLPCLAPSFGMGYRYQHNHHGLDMNVRAITAMGLYDATVAQANLLYDYYFKPSLKSQFYLGAGVGCAYLFGDAISHHHWNDYRHRLLLSPEIVLGKNYVNEAGDERFFQAQIDIPTFKITRWNKPLYAPIVLLTYGLCY
jgi:hypothetical protein